jgi:hypothetical protein
LLIYILYEFIHQNTSYHEFMKSYEFMISCYTYIA